MIKKISNSVMNKLNPNASKEEKKWVNVFNEIQHRTDVLFEALVSWYSVNVFLQNIDVQNIHESRFLFPLRHKSFIYESYIFVELNNLIDPKGNSSITEFINHFSNDISKNGVEFTKIFQPGIDLKALSNHFKVFTKWSEDNSIEIKHFKYMRDKNFSHVDHDFKYNNILSFEYLIQTIVFLSDYTSILPNIMRMMNLRIINGEPTAIQKNIMETTPMDVLRIRFKQEINALSNIFGFDEKNKKNIELNCWDSIEETLKNVNLIGLKFSD